MTSIIDDVCPILSSHTSVVPGMVYIEKCRGGFHTLVFVIAVTACSLSVNTSAIIIHALCIDGPEILFTSWQQDDSQSQDAYFKPEKMVLYDPRVSHE